jgi:hypothetical protein
VLSLPKLPSIFIVTNNGYPLISLSGEKPFRNPYFRIGHGLVYLAKLASAHPLDFIAGM